MNTVLKNRIVYIPIEKRMREMSAKLLVALELTRRDFSVVFGFHRAILANLSNFPPGAVLFKGMNRVQEEFMTQAMPYEHVLLATDEEALGAGDAKYLTTEIQDNVHKLIRLVLCQGETQKRGLATYKNFTEDQLSVVGNPRVDLLREPLRGVMDAEAVEIRAARGPFVLINTNFGATLSDRHSIEEYRRRLITIGWVDPAAPESVALMEAHIADDIANVSAIGNYVRAMNSARPDIRLILRPHPSEDRRHWLTLSNEVGNLEVVENTEAGPWMIACDLLVQTGCTTGVEAAILGASTLSLITQSDGDGFWTNFLSNKINPVVRSIDEAVDFTAAKVDRSETYAFAEAERGAALAEHIAIDLKQTAAEKTAIAIGAIGEETFQCPAPEAFRLPVNLDEHLKRTVKRWVWDDAKMDMEDLARGIVNLSMLDPELSKTETVSLGWGTFLLRAA